MYVLTRVIIFAILAVPLLLVKKTVQKNRQIILVSAVILSVLSTVPLENVFFSFESPEAVFRYCNLGTADIKTVIRGKDCAMIVSDRKGSQVISAAQKTEKGWEIGIGAKLHSKTVMPGDDILVSLYTYKGTNDTFIIVTVYNKNLLSISDSYGSIFTEFEMDEKNTRCSYYAYVPERMSYYELFIDGYTYEVLPVTRDS